MQLDDLKNNIYNYHKRKRRLEQRMIDGKIGKPKLSVGFSEINEPSSKPAKSVTQQVKFAQDA